MERDRQELINVCRIGGRRFTSLSRANQYPAREFATELKTCFEVDVEKDEDDVHPQLICVVCRRVVRRCREAAAGGRSYVPVAEGVMFIKHGQSTAERSVISALSNLSSVVVGSPKRKEKVYHRSWPEVRKRTWSS